MTDLLYALGVGFSFSVGVFAGAYLCRVLAKDNSDKSDWAAHRSEVEARLSVYAENTTRMADAIDKIAGNVTTGNKSDN